MDSFKKKLLDINFKEFDQLALKAFKFQANHNEIYARYLGCLDTNIEKVQSIEQIPFLPIEFFKYHKVVTDDWKPETFFLSSGTTSENRSTHFVKSVNYYHGLAQGIFESSYGDINNIAFFALLPSYFEQGDSSLVSMVTYFIEKSQYEESGHYLNDSVSLVRNIKKLLSKGVKVVLIGVSYALLDLALEGNIDLNGLIIIETGGMKGRKREITKEELYHELSTAFNVEAIHSEYGMTELLSQAYSTGEGNFKRPNSMKVLIRDINDPFTYIPYGKSGGVNIIDLANIDSCCFIETKDIGLALSEDCFKIMGRFDNSDIRGCNLLIS